jgi:hypothetical protein
MEGGPLGVSIVIDSRAGHEPAPRAYCKEQVMNFRVWRIQNKQYAEWWPCRVIIKARSQKEADSKLARKFANAGFHLMGLAAVPFNQNPNAEEGK